MLSNLAIAANAATLSVTPAQPTVPSPAWAGVVCESMGRTVSHTEQVRVRSAKVAVTRPFAVAGNGYALLPQGRDAITGITFVDGNPGLRSWSPPV